MLAFSSFHNINDLDKVQTHVSAFCDDISNVTIYVGVGKWVLKFSSSYALRITDNVIMSRHSSKLCKWKYIHVSLA